MEYHLVKEYHECTGPKGFSMFVTMYRLVDEKGVDKVGVPFSSKGHAAIYAMQHGLSFNKKRSSR